MAIFGGSKAIIGLDIGTSSLKLVELLERKGHVELVTYAQANVPNLLLDAKATEDSVRRMANVISRMFDAAGASTDVIVAALPSSVVFSAVLTLPDLPDADMDKAVHFAARDVVPANLEEMVLGWSRVGHAPHMDSNQPTVTPTPTTTPTTGAPESAPGGTVPIFITAAPKDVVARYTHLTELLQLNLQALEVETFPLARSLLTTPKDSAMIVDIGDTVTTFHLIDQGTARVSHTIEYGGQSITDALAAALHISSDEAEAHKVQYGLDPQAPADSNRVLSQASERFITQGQQLTKLYAEKTGRNLSKIILIGGGANLRRLDEVWAQATGVQVKIGDPWRGLTYPKALETRLKELGPSYAVAVGLAQRAFSNV